MAEPEANLITMEHYFMDFERLIVDPRGKLSSHSC